MSSYEWWKDKLSDEAAKELAKEFFNYVYGPTSSVYLEFWDRLTALFEGQTLSQIKADLSTPGIKGALKKINILSGITGGTRAMAFAFGWPVPSSDEIVEGQLAYEGTDNPPVIFTMQGGIYQLTGKVGDDYPAYPCGILTVPLEKLVCAVAPLFGFSIENEAFFHSQEWYNLREACVQYLWDGTEVSPVIIAAANRAYAEYELVNTIGQHLSSLGPSPLTSIFPPEGSKLWRAMEGEALYADASQHNFWREYTLLNAITYRHSYTTDQPVSAVGFDLGTRHGFVLCSNSPFTGSVISKEWPVGHPEDAITQTSTFRSRDPKTGAFGPYYYQTFVSVLATDTSMSMPGNKPLDTSVYNSADEFIADTCSLFANSVQYGTGVYKWQGDVPTSGWENDNVYVYRNDDGSIKFVHIHLPPYEQKTVTWSPDTNSNPLSDTPPANITPYVPSDGTPLPSYVPPSNPVYNNPQPGNDNYVPPFVNPTPDNWQDWRDTQNLYPSPDPQPPSGSSTPASTPSAETSATGSMIHIYNPSKAQVDAFGRWLWVTWKDAANDITKIWNNPFDGIISLHEIYCLPTRGGQRSITCGWLEADVAAPIVALRYTTIDCGTVAIPEWFSNYFDYSPYSKAFIYLPFIGIVDLDVDDVVGHSVNVHYTCDVYTGACIAAITCSKEGASQRLYEFSGNCASPLPLSGGSQAQLVTGLINAGAQAIVGIGNAFSALTTGSGASAALNNFSGAISSFYSPKSSVQHSGTFGSTIGAMGVKSPYLVIRRPNVIPVNNYNLDYGYPAHKRVVIGACNGYIRVREVNVVSSTATDDEKREIERMLKEGVYVN